MTNALYKLVDFKYKHSLLKLTCEGDNRKLHQIQFKVLIYTCLATRDITPRILTNDKQIFTLQQNRN